MKINAKRIASLIVGGMLMSGIAAAADSVSSSKISYQDLNLNTPAGAATLYARIHTAAYTVCNEAEGNRDLGAMTRQQKCVQQAEDGAIRHINQSAVTAYYQAKTGRTIGSMLASN